MTTGPLVWKMRRRLVEQVLAEGAEVGAAVVHGGIVDGAQHAVGHVGRAGDLQEVPAGVVVWGHGRSLKTERRRTSDTRHISGGCYPGAGRGGRMGSMIKAAASPSVPPISVSQARAVKVEIVVSPDSSKVTIRVKAKAPQAMS